MIDLPTAAPFVREHRGRIVVLKIGGACLSKPARQKRLAKEIALVESLGPRVVVVHGSGPQTDDLQRKLGEEPRKVDGRRITTPTALDALRYATVGHLNAELASALTAAGAKALGLSASSANLVVAHRRPPRETSAGTVDFGHVGDVASVDADALLALLDQGFLPVLSPPAGDGQGGFLNVNADSTAAAVAVALGAHKLIFATSAPGILTDPGDPHSLASTLTPSELVELRAGGVLADGMHVKSVAAEAALEGGVGRVHVVSGVDPGALLGELFTAEGTGTLIAAEDEPQVHVQPAPGARAGADPVLLGGTAT